MRLRNALAIGVTAATIAPAVLTGSAAAAAAAVTPRAAGDVIAGPGADAMAEFGAKAGAGPVARAGAKAGAGPVDKAPADAVARRVAEVPARPGARYRVAAGGFAEPRPEPRPGPGRPKDQQPSCGKPSDTRFPIDTRIHGGPEVHHPGGDSRQWSVDLANTTDETCHNIHPVMIFTARDPGLAPSQIQLEFYDEEAGRWHPVALEPTAEDEIVGVLDGPEFPGFAVPARKSVTVDVRLALAADTGANEVTVNAAIVQRQGDDGDWVGESGDYRFAVVEDDGSGSIVTLDELATTGTNNPALRLVVGAGAVLLGSLALVLAARRFRAGRR